MSKLLKFLPLLILSGIISKTFAVENEPVVLKAIEVPITVNGTQADVFEIVQENGKEGYEGEKGKDFNVILKNQTSVSIAIHWHGLILPNDQDGIPYVTQLPIPPGGSMHYHFPLLQSGTYWMHSHQGFHEQALMAAPLIINDPSDQYKDYKSITIMLQDFSFKTGKEIFAQLKSGDMNMSGMTHMKMKNNNKPDLNDVDYDAYLANRRTLSDPEIIKLTKGKKIRLRIINASAATNYWINLGALSGILIAVDGENIKPITNSKFQIALAQRLDILVTMPADEGEYPILAQVEGTKKQSGIILITSKANPILPAILAKNNVPALNDDQELQLHSLTPLADKPISKTLKYSLDGNMEKYVWTMNHEVWPHIKPLTVKKGDRVEIIFTNNTAMSHPMHLHGHVFQVTKINKKTIIDGPLHDTILVAPHSSKTIVFDALYPGIWAIHCHVLYHRHAGMMTTINYKNYPEPKFYKKLIEQD